MSEVICDYEGTIWGKTEMKFGPFKMLPSLKFELLESDIKDGFSEHKIFLNLAAVVECILKNYQSL